MQREERACKRAGETGWVVVGSHGERRDVLGARGGGVGDCITGQRQEKNSEASEK